MKSIQRKVDGFLKNFRMHPLDVEMETTVQTFLEEMKRGLEGKKSTLEMIPTYLEAGIEPPSGKRVIVADAGGTNFRVAAVYFDDQKNPVIENLQRYQMPGIERHVGKDEFFKTVAAYLKDVAGVSDRMGFCFSYPSEILPSKDARLIRFVKEVKAPEVEGELIGANLNRALAEAGLGGDKRMVLMNDTVATLLAGCGYQNRAFGGYIGFILGTGTNCCYMESNANIKKKKDLDPNQGQIINTESGGMGKGYFGKLDARFDKTTNNPGVHKFEKMISGAYLGPLFLMVMQTACKEGLFGKEATAALKKLSELDTKAMNDFMQYPYGDNPLAVACKQGDPADTQTLYGLADRITERAAKLTAINLAAMALKSGTGTDPTRPIAIVAEGTTFYQMKTLKSRVEFYLKQYLENKKGIYTEIISVENATLIGAAIAGLTN